MTKLVAPPITRVIWASAQARAQWAPKISRAALAWERAERESVLHFRPVAQQLVSPPVYMEMLAWAMTHGLAMRVVRWTGSNQGAFAHADQKGKDLAVVAFGKDREMLAKPEEHFGYPACCQKMFAAAFPADPDPVIPWAVGPQPGLPVIAIEQWTERTQKITRHVTAHPLSSPLLRYIGVRATAHIPCSPTCKGTVEIGKEYLRIMSPEGAAAIEELLALPLTWDRYRGVVIVTSPHFRIIANSSQTPDREVLHVTFD